MRIIAGLGNPGPKYENTRHNLGFMVVDALAKELSLAWENNKKFKAELAKGADLILIKPQFLRNFPKRLPAILFPDPKFDCTCLFHNMAKGCMILLLNMMPVVLVS